MKISKISDLDSKDIFIAGHVYICATGFEDRSLAFLKEEFIRDVQSLVLVRFINGDSRNDESYEKAVQYLDSVQKKYSTVDLNVRNPYEFESSFSNKLSELRSAGVPTRVILDITSFPTYGICIALHVIRSILPFSLLSITYTEAESYFPTKDEFKAASPNVWSVPPSLSSEMSDNLIFEIFAGFPAGRDKTCLIVFPGFEPHRTIGVIESINPSLLVFIFAAPEREDLSGRLTLSQSLHSELPYPLEKSIETMSPLNVDGALALLKSYYEMLYGEYAISVSPINCKLHAVASFLLWEAFPDIQLTFPVPIKYLPERFSKGIRDTFYLCVPAGPSIELLSQATVSASCP